MTVPDDIGVMSTAIMLRQEQTELIPSLEIGKALFAVIWTMRPLG